MADWKRIELVWLSEPPTKKQLFSLNKKLKKMDYDFPGLNENGMVEERWRSPGIKVDELCKVIDAANLRCKFRLLNMDDDPYLYPGSVRIKPHWVYSDGIAIDDPMETLLQCLSILSKGQIKAKV